MLHRLSLVTPLCAALGLVAPLAAPGPAAFARQNAPAADGYHTYEQFTAALQALAGEHPEAIQLTSIGESLQNRSIWAMRIALPGQTAPDKRPSLLLAANIDGDHLAGGEVALRAARDLLDRAGSDVNSDAHQLLSRYTLYIVPRVNPDAAELYFADVKQDVLRNRRPDDADRDLHMDEDPPNDLNGDGLITMMRVYDPEKANRCADPDDPRLDIAPDAEKGQRAEFYVITEGVDDDHDGSYNEDDHGGVDLNRNYMHDWREHEDGVGLYPVSERESLALLKYALAHQNIAIALTYGRHDNLNNTPSGQGTINGGAPVNIDGADVPVYRAVGEAFRKITGLQNVTSPPVDGSFHAWAYAQYGIPSFATPVWSRPSEAKEGDDEKADEPKDGESNNGGAKAAQDDFSDILEAAKARGMEVTIEQLREMPPDRITFFRQMIATGSPRGAGGAGGAPGAGAGGSQPPPSGGGGRGGFRRGGGGFQPGGQAPGGARDAGGGRARGNSEGDKGWLEYSTDKRNGEGFVEWKEFDHPQLGKVEIGGFVPYFRTDPPAEELDTLAGKQADFILDLLGKMPAVSLTEATITKLAPGLYELKAALVNDGFLPAGTRMAVRTRRALPFVVRVDLPEEQVISGQRVAKIWSLAGSGGRNDFRWIIRADDGSSVRFTLFSAKYGSSEQSITLEESPN